MASKLKQLQSKACQASKFVAQHGNAYYKELMEKNKQYVVDPPSVETCNTLAKQLFYTRLARLFSLYLCCLYDFCCCVFLGSGCSFTYVNWITCNGVIPLV